jgi:hypothetical protein
MSGASPEPRADLASVSPAQLTSSSAYHHPRLVRLLSYAIDEEGSLADYLRGPGGEAQRAPGPPLTPLERVDVALGAAAGLAYLHGLREDAELGAGGAAAGGGGGGGGGAAAAAAPPPLQAPMLHLDIKSSNIGLMRSAAGALHAKVLDCSLARALKIGAALDDPAARSTTGGVVGTLGYVAPELSTGSYTPRSDIYALGCVLLELLSGARVGPLTVQELEYHAIELGEGVDAVRALAEACWLPPAAAALAALVLACIHLSPRKRPAAMGEVLAGLRALRALVAPPDAPPLLPCPVCLEDVPEAGGLRCATAQHFICHGCLQAHVCVKVAALAELKLGSGNIPCPTGGCPCAWRMEAMEEVLDKGTLVAYAVALRRMAIDGPAEVKALAAAQAAALVAAAQMALAERVEELRRVIVERDLLLRCPGCGAVFEEYDGCNALQCGRCGTGFCAVCLKDCGADTHEHHAAAHGPDLYNRALFELTRRERFVERVVAAVRVAREPAVQRALVAALGEADLRDLGIDVAEVLVGAGVVMGALDALVVVLSAEGFVMPVEGMSAARVVDLMGIGAESPSVAEAGLSVLASIARSAIGKKACVMSDAVPAVVAAFRAHLSSSVVAEYGCRVLMELLPSIHKNDADLLTGVLRAVLAALALHPGNSDVVENSCIVLSLDTEFWIGACLSTDTAVPAVVAALNAHGGTAFVALNCFLTLLGFTLSIAGIESCVAAGAASAVVATLLKHSGETSVFPFGILPFGYGVLSNIAFIEPGRDALVFSGAVPVLVLGLKNHMGELNVVEQACRALSLIAAASPSHCDTIVAAGAVPFLATALATHPGLALAREALENLEYEACGKLKLKLLPLPPPPPPPFAP